MGIRQRSAWWADVQSIADSYDVLSVRGTTSAHVLAHLLDSGADPIAGLTKPMVIRRDEQKDAAWRAHSAYAVQVIDRFFNSPTGYESHTSGPATLC